MPKPTETDRRTALEDAFHQLSVTELSPVLADFISNLGKGMIDPTKLNTSGKIDLRDTGVDSSALEELPLSDQQLAFLQFSELFFVVEGGAKSQVAAFARARKRRRRLMA